MQVPGLAYEQSLWQAGMLAVAGVDEAGRGAWAGAVYAGAVILSPAADWLERLPGVRDSKLMTARQRQHWAGIIKQTAQSWAVGFSTHTEIDALGIVPATRLAMQRAVAQLLPPPQHLLVDAVRLPALDIPQTALIRGDSLVLSIAAASVLAKTARDAALVELDTQYPGYGFARHKGYGTAMHREALLRLGACPVHRFSFAPLRQL